MDVGHDTPDKQGDNCLQPASENYQQILFSLKATFGGFVWKFRLEIPFGNFVRKFRLEISFGKFRLESFVWKFRLEIWFGRQTDGQTDRPTERLVEAPSRSLKKFSQKVLYAIES